MRLKQPKMHEGEQVKHTDGGSAIFENGRVRMQRSPDLRDDERTDEQLMGAIKADEAMALEALFGRHWAKLLRFVQGLLDCPDSSEDVVQESFVCLWEHRQEWQAGGSVRSYLYRVARNRALNEARYRTIRRDHRNKPVQVRVPPLPTPVDRLKESEIRKAVETALSELPPRRREVFVLTRLEGRSYAEASEIMGISLQTVANQMSAALATLRPKLRSLVTR